jgi:N6-L-threonylcarbamoyladenine synthase
MIGFPFPAGAEIDKRAIGYSGERLKLPYGKVKADPLAFSFSGLKTAVLYHLQANHTLKPDGSFELDEIARSRICHGLMTATARSLSEPIKRALDARPYRALIVSGGVSASRFLRRALAGVTEEYSIPLIIPPFHHCTDNGSMIAYACALMIDNGIAPSLPGHAVNPSADVCREPQP